MTTMQVTGYLECPQCGAQFECTFPALYDSGFVPEQRCECPDCDKVFVVTATVNVAIRKAKA